MLVPVVCCGLRTRRNLILLVVRAAGVQQPRVGPAERGRKHKQRNPVARPRRERVGGPSPGLSGRKVPVFGSFLTPRSSLYPVVGPRFPPAAPAPQPVLPSETPNVRRRETPLGEAANESTALDKPKLFGQARTEKHKDERRLVERKVRK